MLTYKKFVKHYKHPKRDIKTNIYSVSRKCKIKIRKKKNRKISKMIGKETNDRMSESEKKKVIKNIMKYMYVKTARSKRRKAKVKMKQRDRYGGNGKIKSRMAAYDKEIKSIIKGMSRKYVIKCTSLFSPHKIL